jgi:hypothetical protein
VNREAIARAHRRRQATDALGFEREREATLQEQVGDLIAELEGAGVDEAVFARIPAEDAALVRSLLLPPEEAEVEVMDEEERRLMYGDESPEDEEPDPREWTEEEIARLEEEIAESRRRQQALERYLEALDGSG